MESGAITDICTARESMATSEREMGVAQAIMIANGSVVPVILDSKGWDSGAVGGQIEIGQ